MYEVLSDIIESIRAQGPLDGLQLGQILNKHNKRVGGTERSFSKKRMLPYYQRLKEENPALWESLEVDEALEKDVYSTLRMKPRRTASGVATITVITKPHACAGSCIYCPNDVRMPKSYLHREPACQRAERNYFDPYLQVASRLRALKQMGHPCDKIELIVLGGSWTDYPEEYQIWFMTELFRALNESDDVDDAVKERKRAYRSSGIDGRDDVLEERSREVQRQVNEGGLTYNDAIDVLYGSDSPWNQVSAWQSARIDDLLEQQKLNETGKHRVVGLVVETRPEAVTPASLERIRLFGCTKVQIGVQSLQPEILALNGRVAHEDRLREAFDLLRVFGFKIHTHFMLNLYGSSIASDKLDYERFVTDRAFVPDEVKLYPCVLVEGTKLVELHDAGKWHPYDENDLIDVLAHDILKTPSFTRVSRMIRDISAEDIIAGSKKTNLRQMVEETEELREGDVREIRFREIAGDEIDLGELQLVDVSYETTNTCEHFLQWVTPENRIAGFLRLSLPDVAYVDAHRDELPSALGEAMIREVHVYGQVANLHKVDGSAQHQGLGRQLVERACELSRGAGFSRINVISSVGTREYYRKLGFKDGTLYQTREL